MILLKDFPNNKQIFIDSLVRNVYDKIDTLPNEIKGEVKNTLDTLDLRGKVVNTVDKLARENQRDQYTITRTLINEVLVHIYKEVAKLKLPLKQYSLVRDVCYQALICKIFEETNNIDRDKLDLILDGTIGEIILRLREIISDHSIRHTVERTLAESRENYHLFFLKQRAKRILKQ
ncbi:MAG: hypothetical protein AB1349_11705 [Elusimicrobiota bacterium]